MYTYIGSIELNITKKQAAKGSHPGACDNEILELSDVPAIRNQLKALDPAIVKKELSFYVGWDSTELQDHEQNLQSLLWIACGDINDEYGS